MPTKIHRILIGLSASLLLADYADSKAASDPEPGPHYTRARELYALGPEKADEIIKEPDLELVDHPESLQALSLKANAQIGVGQFDGALATLDRYDEITRKADTISPVGIFLRARCLYHKGDYESARLHLEPFWAFFQDSDGNKAKYDDLMAAIVAKLPPPKEK